MYISDLFTHQYYFSLFVLLPKQQGNLLFKLPNGTGHWAQNTRSARNGLYAGPTKNWQFGQKVSAT